MPVRGSGYGGFSSQAACCIALKSQPGGGTEALVESASPVSVGEGHLRLSHALSWPPAQWAQHPLRSLLVSVWGLEGPGRVRPDQEDGARGGLHGGGRHRQG